MLSILRVNYLDLSQTFLNRGFVNFYLNIQSIQALTKPFNFVMYDTLLSLPIIITIGKWANLAFCKQTRVVMSCLVNTIVSGWERGNERTQCAYWTIWVKQKSIQRNNLVTTWTHTTTFIMNGWNKCVCKSNVRYLKNV